MKHSYINKLTNENLRKTVFKLNIEFLSIEEKMYLLDKLFYYSWYVSLEDIVNRNYVYAFPKHSKNKLEYQLIIFTEPDENNDLFLVEAKHISKLIKLNKTVQMSFEEYIKGVLVC